MKGTISIPKWVIVPILTLVGAGAADRLKVEHRLTSAEDIKAQITDIQQRVHSIDQKLDAHLQHSIPPAR